MCSRCRNGFELVAEINSQLKSGERTREFYREQGRCEEQKRIIKLLMDLNVVRRCGATNKLVAFNTDGDKVVYLTGLESTNE